MTGMWTNSQDGPWLLKCVRGIAQISQVNKGGGSLDGNSWTSMSGTARGEKRARLEGWAGIARPFFLPLVPSPHKRAAQLNPELRASNDHSRTVGGSASRKDDCLLPRILSPLPLQSKI